jgi:hypothetical protein
LAGFALLSGTWRMERTSITRHAWEQKPLSLNMKIPSALALSSVSHELQNVNAASLSRHGGDVRPATMCVLRVCKPGRTTGTVASLLGD